MRRIERDLRRFDVVPLLDAELAPRAGRNYRALRDLGVTIPKTADIIGTFCIERCCALLHDDRDFAQMEEHLDEIEGLAECLSRGAADSDLVVQELKRPVVVLAIEGLDVRSHHFQ